jgi:acyl transferase domain-containing protein
VEALGRACVGLKKQSCYIGSVKSNIGHLTPAAGVAGTIKTALILQHKIIPPTLHFTNPNPDLKLSQSPFKVNGVQCDFPSGKKYAGVSSFGVGGTNVHLVLEGVSSRPSSHYKSPIHLFVLSAPNTHNLSVMPQRLAKHLAAHQDINLNDVSFTLLTGRQHFENRYVAVGGASGIIDTLNGKDGHAFTGKKLEKVNGVVFMFPGQGSQYPGMGKDLYVHEPVFKKWIDHCSSILLKWIDKDLRELMFAPHTAENEALLKNTQYAQPSIFMFEYALAQLYISKGITPNGFVGHSIGEFTAACLSGIFNLDDALKLVASRAKLMQAMPKGSMLSVRKSPDDLKAYINQKVSLASHNSPLLSVLSGPSDAIELTKNTLEANNIPCSLLHTSHAFHSAMMDEVIPEFKKTVESISLARPRIPIVSTVTGNWMKDAEATDVTYWSHHLRVPVKFSDAINTLIPDDYFLLELGPRNTLATLARQHVNANPTLIAPSINEVEGENAALIGFYKAIGKLWVVGADVNLETFFAEQQTQKIPLPTYPFAKKRYWIEPPLVQTNSQTPTIIQDEHANLMERTMETTIAPQALKTKLTALLFEVLEESSGLEINHADLSASLFELGFDSLILTQLAITLQRKFDVRITFRQLNEDLSTLNRLIDYLESHMPEAKAKSLFGIEQAQHPVNQTSAVLKETMVQSSGSLEAQLREIKQQLDLVSKSLGLSVATKQIVPQASPALIEEVPDLKKPFGAAAKIETSTNTDLSPAQKGFIDHLIEQYNHKTAKSKAYTQANRKNLADPRVVTGFRPLTKELTYQVVVERSKGCRMWDIDGNEYLDVLSGFGSNMFGNNPEFITKVLHEQLDRGCELGPQHVLAGEVTQMICEMTGFDRAALCNTGSEAVLGALRMARTVTGKSKVVMFNGSYHGINDEVITRGSKKLKSFPAAPGIPSEAVANTLILDYGTDEALQIIHDNLHDLAAVLVEPVQSRRPDFRPVEFLHKLRAMTQEAGVALIFDEVITGFRSHPKGAQGLFGIKADLATYGKVIGGGMPIGVMAGIERFMDSLDGGHWQFGDDSIPTIGVTYFAGTFVRHPLALAAAKASLQLLKSENGAIQENLNHITANMANAMNSLCLQNNWPIEVKYFSSLFKIVYKQDVLFSELLFTLMRLKGIHIMDGFPCFITTAHTQADVNQLVATFKECATEMARVGFYGGNISEKNMAVPPVEGARLGRAQNGDPAWFIPDPDRPGKYLQIV